MDKWVDSFEFFKIDIPSMIDDNMSRVISAVRHRERTKTRDFTTGPSVRRNSYKMPLVEPPSVRFDTDTGLSPTNNVISGDATQPDPSN